MKNNLSGETARINLEKLFSECEDDFTPVYLYINECNEENGMDIKGLAFRVAVSMGKVKYVSENYIENT